METYQKYSGPSHKLARNTDYSIVSGSALKLWDRVANFYTLFIFMHEILVKGKISLLHSIAESSVGICASRMHVYYCYKTPLYHVSVFYQNSEFLTNTLTVPFLYWISIYSCLSTFFSMEVCPPHFQSCKVIPLPSPAPKKYSVA